MMIPTIRPASGATSIESAARVSSAVSARWTSSSRRPSAARTTMSAAWPAKRAALSGSVSQPATREAIWAEPIRSASTSPLRKYSVTNPAKPAPIWSFLARG